MPKLLVEAEARIGDTRTYPSGVSLSDARPDGTKGLIVETVEGRIANVEPGDWVLIDTDGRGRYPLPTGFAAAVPVAAADVCLAALRRVIEWHTSAAGGINFELNALREAESEILASLRQDCTTTNGDLECVRS